MTGFNNNNIKFVPTAPKTFQVLELRDQQQQLVKKSPLSAAARSKVINRSGSNYLSESEEYGPLVYLAVVVAALLLFWLPQMVKAKVEH